MAPYSAFGGSSGLESSSPLRGLASWFLDSDHVVAPVIQNRLCVDTFFSYLGFLVALALTGFASLATYFDFGIAATPYHAVVAVLAGLTVVWLLFGEWALSGSGSRASGLFHSRPVEVYGYMVGLWWLTLAILWTGIADFAQIREARQFIDSNWYLLQVQVVIPFTTQLDSKKSLEFNSKVILSLSVILSFLLLQPLTEAWRALGGGLHMVQLKFGTLLIEAVPLLVLSALTAGYAGYAADLSAFESPYGPAALLWQTAMCAIAFLAVLASIAAVAVLGISFATHVIVAGVLTVPAFVVFVTSVVTLARAGEVDSFVTANWETLRHFVAPQYAALPPKTYAAAAYTPMVQAGAAGVFLSVLLVLSIAFHFRAAAIIQAVGSELYVIKTHLLRQRAALLRVARGLALTVEDAALATPLDSDPLVPLMAALGEAAPGAGDGDAYAYAEGSARDRTAASPAAASSSRGLFPTAYSTGYGSVGASSVSAGSSIGGAGRSSREAWAEVDTLHAPAASESSALRGGVGGSSNDAAGATSARATAERRIAAWRQSQQLAVDYEAQLRALQPRVKLPPWGVFSRTVKTDVLQAWGGHWKCIVGTGFTCVLVLAVLSGGLVAIADDAVCSKLVGASSTVFKSVSAEIPLAYDFDGFPTDFKFPSLDIDHQYPLGSVEVFQFDAAPVNSPEVPKVLIINATFFASRVSDLPDTAAAFKVVQGGFVAQHDDYNAGYSNVSISLVPPSGTARCSGVNLRIYTNAAYLIANFKSISAAVWLWGNANSTNMSPFINTNGYQTLEISTVSAPVVLTNVYVDSLSLGPNFLPLPASRPAHNVPSLTVRSQSGYILLDNVLCTGVYATSSGNVRAQTVLSTQVTQFSGVGDIVLAATGSGRTIVTQAIGAYSAKFSTESGALVIANAGLIVGTTVDVVSYSGAVYLNNFIQLAGNVTSVTTRGLITLSAVFANVLNVLSLGDANVNMAVIYAGLNATAAPVQFIPPFQGDYPFPAVNCNTTTGDVVVLSIGNNPSSETFADVLSLVFYSRDGKIKMEINGGGVNAGYEISSGASSATFEVDGEAISNKGEIGEGSSPVANNRVYVRSDTDTVQVAILASPL